MPGVESGSGGGAVVLNDGDDTLDDSSVDLSGTYNDDESNLDVNSSGASGWTNNSRLWLDWPLDVVRDSITVDAVEDNSNDAGIDGKAVLKVLVELLVGEGRTVAEVDNSRGVVDCKVVSCKVEKLVKIVILM